MSSARSPSPGRSRRVFDYLSDFTHTNEWDPGTVETRRTSGDGGVGTTYANTSEFMGRRSELTYETVELRAPAPAAVPRHTTRR